MIILCTFFADHSPIQSHLPLCGHSNFLYSLTDVIIIKSRRMRWGASSAHGEVRNAYEMLVGQAKGKRLLEDLDIDGIIILKQNFGR